MGPYRFYPQAPGVSRPYPQGPARGWRRELSWRDPGGALHNRRATRKDIAMHVSVTLTATSHVRIDDDEGVPVSVSATSADEADPPDWIPDTAALATASSDRKSVV